MPRFDAKRPKMISVTTSPSEDGRMVQVSVEGEVLGAVTPNVLKGVGVPIDVDDPASWHAEVRLNEGFFEALAKPKSAD